MRRRRRPLDTPEFPDDVAWLNVDAPVRLHDLTGKLVLLHFWTACCINCAHTISELRELAGTYPSELVIIGVHSPKCSSEREIGQLRLAVRRQEIEYAVVDDRDMRIWRAWEIEAWPTSVLIDPKGRVVARHTGEDLRRVLGGIIDRTIQDADRAGEIDHTPIACPPEDAGPGESGLTFPEGILADERSARLFISDTNANRMVVADFEGAVLDVIGSGEDGLADGSFERAEFQRPHGAALDGNQLYVADTENHAIRRIDLDTRTVSTIAGTGRPAPVMVETGSARSVSLISPWDLEIVHHRLYVTMAGAHQIWRLDLHSGETEPYAGGASAGFVDGSRASSLLAQPSGLTGDGVRIYFTDAGASAIRWVYLPPAVQLGTWVGQGVFEYGDRDGPGSQALLQFPLGLEHRQGELYVADTYNNKIKRFNPRTSRISTVLGSGDAGEEDGEFATFNEPRDLSCAAGRLWIADTNNHAIRVASLDGGAVSTLQLHPQERLAQDL